MECDPINTKESRTSRIQRRDGYGRNMEEPRAQKSAIHGLPPPAYAPKRKVSRQTWVWESVVLLLLAVIVVGATLIGVYMTQKHTEAVVEMAFQAGSGEKVQQTVIVNDKENVAAVYVNINDTSTTILYDYRREIIGFRSAGDSECYVTKMSNSNVPTMADILSSIKHPQQENVSGTDYVYNLTRGEKADKTKLGLPINLLCSDVTVYWASQDSDPKLRFKKWFKKIKNSVKKRWPEIAVAAINTFG